MSEYYFYAAEASASAALAICHNNLESAAGACGWPIVNGKMSGRNVKTGAAVLFAPGLTEKWADIVPLQGGGYGIPSLRLRCPETYGSLEVGWALSPPAEYTPISTVSD